MSTEALKNAVADAVAQVARSNFCGIFDTALAKAVGQCQSPIEFGFLSALLVQCVEQSIDVEIFHPGDKEWIDVWSSGVKGNTRVRVTPQWPHERKRIDFHVELGEDRAGNGYSSHVLLIECDGHDYHERTKEQAQKDKSRDRELTTAGFQIFRFTGSEIFRDAPSCAQSVLTHLAAAERRRRASERKRDA